MCTRANQNCCRLLPPCCTRVVSLPPLHVRHTQKAGCTRPATTLPLLAKCADIYSDVCFFHNTDPLKVEVQCSIQTPHDIMSTRSLRTTRVPMAVLPPYDFICSRGANVFPPPREFSHICHQTPVEECARQINTTKVSVPIYTCDGGAQGCASTMELSRLAWDVVVPTS